MKLTMDAHWEAILSDQFGLDADAGLKQAKLRFLRVLCVRQSNLEGLQCQQT
ncbi:hypothetical protein [Ruegeria arenilitoris]|uniref:hypothetical protein n=1 Tax=Ruegeria arenilitoris TaxID=1173585 RepID=UPI00147CB0CC|nr:hypothetical protein [Ruegeria arenilitoris]